MIDRFGWIHRPMRLPVTISELFEAMAECRRRHLRVVRIELGNEAMVDIEAQLMPAKGGATFCGVPVVAFGFLEPRAVRLIGER